MLFESHDRVASDGYAVGAGDVLFPADPDGEKLIIVAGIAARGQAPVTLLCKPGDSGGREVEPEKSYFMAAWLEEAQSSLLDIGYDAGDAGDGFCFSDPGACFAQDADIHTCGRAEAVVRDGHLT